MLGWVFMCWTSTIAMTNVSCSRTQCSESGEARTHIPSILRQALYHWATHCAPTLTIWTLIRLLPWEQSYLGPYCLQYRLLTRGADNKSWLVGWGLSIISIHNLYTHLSSSDWFGVKFKDVLYSNEIPRLSTLFGAAFLKLQFAVIVPNFSNFLLFLS